MSIDNLPAAFDRTSLIGTEPYRAGSLGPRSPWSPERGDRRGFSPPPDPEAAGQGKQQRGWKVRACCSKYNIVAEQHSLLFMTEFHDLYVLMTLSGHLEQNACNHFNLVIQIYFQKQKNTFIQSVFMHGLQDISKPASSQSLFSFIKQLLCHLLKTAIVCLIGSNLSTNII
jgi:hypothetical protein